MEFPSCSGPVTMEIGPNQPVSASVADALLAADEGERIVISRICWECGWTEDRSVSLDSVETTDGDTHTVERAALLDDIMQEATAIDDLATLKDALAEVRRQRRLEPSTADTEEDTTE